MSYSTLITILCFGIMLWHLKWISFLRSTSNETHGQQLSSRNFVPHFLDDFPALVMIPEHSGG